MRISHPLSVDPSTLEHSESDLTSGAAIEVARTVRRRTTLAGHCEAKGESMRRVTLTANGVRHDLEVEPRELLVYVLRERLGLTGTNVGCDTSSCGACTVLVNGESVKSCTMLGVQADGMEITTIEGLATKRRAPSRPAGVPRPPRAPVRLLHAGDGARGGQPHRQRRARPTRPRSAKASRGTSAAAPGTTTSSRRSHRRRGWRHDRHRDRTEGYVGTSVKRKEDASLLRGRGTFVDNLDAARHGLHGRRPQPVPARAHHEREPRRRARGGGCRRGVLGRRPRGRVGGRPAVRLAGDRGHQDAAALPARIRRGPLPGRPVAVVVAESRALAKDAAELVEVDYEPLPSIADVAEGARGRRAARARGPRHERVLRLEARDGRASRLRSTRPTSSSRDATSSRGSYRTRSSRGACSRRSGPTGEVTLWSATQTPHILRFALQLVLGIPESKIRVIAPTSAEASARRSRSTARARSPSRSPGVWAAR